VQTATTVIIIGAYVTVLTYVALRARAAHDFTEFSLAKRALPLVLVFGSLSATYVGPAFSIGFVGKGFHSGLVFLGMGLAFSLQKILVGLLVAPRLRALKECHTLGDIMGLKYNRPCQIIAGVISVGLCGLLAAVGIKAGGLIITDIFDLPTWSAVVIIAGVTTLYTTFGGLRASVITDAFQFTAFAILLPGVFIWILFTTPGTGNGLFAQELATTTTRGWQSLSGVEVAGLITAFFLGEMLIPPVANRALAADGSITSRNGFLLAGGFSVVWFIVMIGLGVLARTTVPLATEEDKVLLTLVRNTLSTHWYALILVVLISIVMSTLDSLLNAGAVAFTQDIVRPFTRVGDLMALQIGRCATVFLAILAALCAVVMPSIIDGLINCYTIWAPAILPSLIIGLWIKKPVPLAGILSMLSGTVTALVFILVFMFILPDKPVVLAIIPALLMALLGYVIGHALGKVDEGDQS
jgi:solute:Na+ symporter, SSS family